MKTRSYTREMLDVARYEGIKGLTRFTWVMQKTGRLHLGTIVFGIATAVFGIIGFLVTGSAFALIFFGLGSYLVGTADGRFCVCDEDPCDNPRTMYTDLYPNDVKPDGTINTPHDRMYRPADAPAVKAEGDGFGIVA